MLVFEYYKGLGIEYVSMIGQTTVYMNGEELRVFSGGLKSKEEAKKWIDEVINA